MAFEMSSFVEDWDEHHEDLNLDWDTCVLSEFENTIKKLQNDNSTLRSAPLLPVFPNSCSPAESSKPLSAGSLAQMDIPEASSSHSNPSLSAAADPSPPRRSELLQERQAMIESVASICGISAPHAHRLLDACRWIENSAIEWFFSDPLASEQIGLAPPTAAPSQAVRAIPYQASADNSAKRQRITTFSCDVCFGDTTDFSTLEGCGHTFCNECWAQYFEHQISDRENSISCMAQGCQNPVAELFLSNLVSEECYSRYLDVMQRHFVQRSLDIRYCPKDGKIVRDPVRWKNCRTGTCSCGHSFCFDCELSAHSPASCEMMRTWNISERWKHDQASTAWILKNTKDCPKCGVPIQKDRGCFLMVCRGLNCKHKFCWLCGGDWSTHPDHFACATFGDVGTSDQPEWRDRSSISESRLQRASEARYFTMYQEHDRASQYEAEAQKHMEDHLALLQDRSSTFYLYNVDFVREAYKVIFAVRYFLKYTYIYALYAPDTPEKQVFQQQQAQLEMIAERLSHLLEPAESSAEKGFDSEKVKSLTTVARTTLYKMAELSEH